MKTMLNFLLIFCLSLLATGCATGPRFAEVKGSIGTVNPQQGRLFFYRTTTLGAAIQPQIKVNGEPVGKSMAQGFMFVDREPGNYEILTSTEVDRKLSLTLEKGQTRYVRFGVSMGFFVGHVYPELVEPDLGQEEIQQCSYAGALPATSIDTNRTAPATAAGKPAPEEGQLSQGVTGEMPIAESLIEAETEVCLEGFGQSLCDREIIIQKIQAQRQKEARQQAIDLYIKNNPGAAAN